METPGPITMIALGLDPSLRAFGWCVYTFVDDQHVIVDSGHEASFKSDVPVARYTQFRALVESLLTKYEPECVGIESPAYDAGPFQSIHFALMMYCLEAAFEARKDVVLFDPATVKFLAKRKPGKAIFGKTEMISHVKTDIPTLNSIDNNEADAYIVAKYSSHFFRIIQESLDLQDLEENEYKVFLGRIKRHKKGDSVTHKRVAHLFKENQRYYAFSKVPRGSVKLPKISQINPAIVSFLEGKQEESNGKSTDSTP